MSPRCTFKKARICLFDERQRRLFDGRHKVASQPLSFIRAYAARSGAGIAVMTGAIRRDRICGISRQSFSAATHRDLCLLSDCQ